MTTRNNGHQKKHEEPIDVEYEDINPPSAKDRFINGLMRSFQTKPLDPRTVPPRQTTAKTLPGRLKDYFADGRIADAERGARVDQVVGDAQLTIDKNKATRKALLDIHQNSLREAIEAMRKRDGGLRIIKGADDFYEMVQMVADRGLPPELTEEVIRRLTDQFFPEGGRNGLV